MDWQEKNDIGGQEIFDDEKIDGKLRGRQDAEVLLLLKKMITMSAGQIKKLCFGNKQYGYHRLRYLTKTGVIISKPLTLTVRENGKRHRRKVTSMYSLTNAGASLVGSDARTRPRNEYLYKYYLMGEIYTALVTANVISGMSWLSAHEVRNYDRKILRTSQICAAIISPEVMAGIYHLQSKDYKDVWALMKSMGQGFDRYHIVIAKYSDDIRKKLTKKLLSVKVTVLSEAESAEWLQKTLSVMDMRRGELGEEILNKAIKHIKNRHKKLDIRKAENIFVPAYFVTGYREFYLVEYVTRNENVLAVIRDRIKRGQDHFMVAVADDEQERIVRTVLGDSPYVKTLRI